MACMKVSTPGGPLRIGILGVAAISAKTALAISNPQSDCVVTVVASRSLEKAENFVGLFFPGQHVAIEAYGGLMGYDALIQSASVDAVYIPLPTSLKKDWVLKALRAGKHVVLEKPAACSAADFEEMLTVAYAQNKFLMDGSMFPHHIRTKQLLNDLSTKSSESSQLPTSIGRIDRLEATFTFLAEEDWMNSNIRARKQNGDPQGCLGDIGWYCIYFALLVYGKLGYRVESAQAVDFELNKHEVPIEATCVVRFEGGKVLWFHCGFKTSFRQRFEICGAEKSVTIDDLVLPTFGRNGFVVTSSTLTKNDLFTVHDREVVECDEAPAQEVLLWKNFAKFARCIDAAPGAGTSNYTEWVGESELIKEANGLVSMTMMNQKVLDALMESIEKNCVPIPIV